MNSKFYQRMRDGVPRGRVVKLVQVVLSLAAAASFTMVMACDTQVLPEGTRCTPPTLQSGDSGDSNSGGSATGLERILQCERGLVCRPNPYSGTDYTCQKAICYHDHECHDGYWCRELVCKKREGDLCRK